MKARSLRSLRDLFPRFLAVLLRPSRCFRYALHKLLEFLELLDKLLKRKPIFDLFSHWILRGWSKSHKSEYS